MRVRAKEQGFDNLVIREAGEEFDMPDDSFDKTVAVKDEDGKKTGEMRAPEHFFEPVDAKPAKGKGKAAADDLA